MFGASGRSQYQPLINDDPVVESRPVTWQSARYREHVKYGRNPDQFYVDIYEYHQAGGFWSIFLNECLWVVKFVFIVFVGIELTVCTRWNVLTNNTAPVNEWSDVFVPPGQCWASLPLLPSLLVTGAIIGLVLQLFIVANRLKRFWETRLFCTYILNMPTSSTALNDLTWSEVQKRLIASQPQSSIDELSICHRIDRHVNYLIAMVDQDILPVRFNLSTTDPPLTHVYLPEGYLYNIKLLLFWTPWSPFAQHWILKTEYKEIGRRHELADHLAKMSRIFGFLNLLFAPIILLAQFLVFICSNAERIRYHPASIMGRRWSNYAGLYLRHYNELRHQFLVRIGLAYEPACQYMDCFVSRNLISVAETIAFVLGSASVAFFLLGLVHDQVLHLTGYWAILVVGGLLARACLSYIPDESAVRSPRALLINILGKIHHFREHWIEQSETSRVCAEFSQLFQYRLCAALEDLVSSVVTPFILMFVLPNHTLEIVDFLRNYTVDLKELGDVCSFAQLDVRRHGDPNWKFFGSGGVEETEPRDDMGGASTPTNQLVTPPVISTGGKTELSLMHFHLNNPECTLPPASQAYLESIRLQILKDMAQPIVQHGSESNNQRDGLQSANLFSSLYGIPSTADPVVQPRTDSIPPFSSSEFTASGPLKNASQLPGPGFVDGKSMGFVGAMVESMRRSMQMSDPGSTVRSTLSDSTTPKVKPSGGKEIAGSVDVDQDANKSTPSVAPSSPSHNIVPPLTYGLFSQSRGMDAVNNSLMAASATLSTYPTYKPYVSQIENGGVQNWGLGASYALGHSLNKHGLTELLTTDTSASILYMHELAYRKRLHQSVEQSTTGARLMGHSSLTGAAAESTHGLSTQLPYQLSHTSASSIRNIGGGRSSVFTVRSGNDRGFHPPSNYGATASAEPVGVIRSASDRGIISRQVDRVTEEDELSVTPRLTTDSTFRAAQGVRSTTQALPSSSLIAEHGTTIPTASHDLEGGFVEETDTEHLWPDLPPTNC